MTPLLCGVMPLQDRGIDGFGDGAFESPRGDKKHRGIDYQVEPGTPILVHMSGRVSRFGFCYSDDLSYRYVQITDDENFEHRFMYVEPSEAMSVGDWVNGATIIGTAQNIGARYPSKTRYMRPHIHYEVRKRKPDGRSFWYLNPETFDQGNRND